MEASPETVPFHFPDFVLFLSEKRLMRYFVCLWICENISCFPIAIVISLFLTSIFLLLFMFLSSTTLAPRMVYVENNCDT
jgi:hypothetical protein